MEPIGMIDMEGYSSFDAVLRLCKVTDELCAPVIGLILGKQVRIDPKSNPHELYKRAFPEYGQ